MIPEENRPPLEIRRTRRYLKRTQPMPDFVAAVIDPTVNALTCAFGPARSRLADPLRRQRERLVERALWRGPEDLDRGERMALLNDPIALSKLHFRVWTSGKAHPEWKREREGA